MSWFKRKRNFVEDEDALADDIDTEFDVIADAFNSLFVAGQVAASSNLGLNGFAEDCPGTPTSITAGVSSLLKIEASFDFEILRGGRGQLAGICIGSLWVDGARQAGEAIMGVQERNEIEGLSARGTHPATWAIPLSAGSHSVLLAAEVKNLAGGCSALAYVGNTRFSYLLIPDPEP